MQSLYTAISKSLSGRMLGHALALLRTWAIELEETVFSDRLQSLLRNYQYVADYYMSGQDDPHRQDVIDSLVREAYILLDDIYLQKRRKEALSSEFVRMQHPSDGFASPEAAFDYFWLRILEDWDRDSLLSLVHNSEMEDEALMGVSALTLNILRSFSQTNILCLMKAAAEDVEPCIRERAWVGVIVIMLVYDERLRYFPDIVCAFQDLCDTDDGRVYARTALTCLLRTMGVEWATEAYNVLQQNIISNMSRLMPELDDPSSSPSTDDINDITSRLEDECGDIIAEQRSAMAQLHEQHLDMQFAMFSNLYTTPFFSEPYRWWLPYAPDYLPESLRRYDAILSQLQMDDLCDSDKYAFISGMSGVGMINGQSVDEMLKTDEKTSSDKESALLCNGYVKQLYRFFNLNPWQIDNPLARLPEIADTQLFRLLNPTAQEKYISARHCMGCHAYAAAADILALIVDTLDSADAYCNYAFSLQQLKRYDEAILFYSKTIQQETSEWVLRQMSYCYRKLGRYSDALDTIGNLLAIHPDNTTYIFEKAKSLEHLELYAEALQQYYRIELVCPKDDAVLRAIAWCSFMCDDYDTADRYFCRLREINSLQKIDYLNMGHLYFVMARRMDALQAYQHCMQMTDSLRDFLSLFRPDRKFLMEKGITKNDIYFMEDQLILLRH